MGQGSCTLALGASQCFVYRGLTGRVIVVTVIVIKGQMHYARLHDRELFCNTASHTSPRFRRLHTTTPRPLPEPHFSSCVMTSVNTFGDTLSMRVRGDECKSIVTDSVRASCCLCLYPLFFFVFVLPVSLGSDWSSRTVCVRAALQAHSVSLELSSGFSICAGRFACFGLFRLLAILEDDL